MHRNLTFMQLLFLASVLLTGHPATGRETSRLQAKDDLPAELLLFKSRSHGYRQYRIPSILTTRNGVVIAVCEGRHSRSVHSWNDLVLRRSEDGGNSWEKQRTLVDAGFSSVNNPLLLEDRMRGVVYLFYQVYSIDDRKRPTGDLFGDLQCKAFYRTSSDDGKTWSAAVDITDIVLADDSRKTAASGPGKGIQLRTGEFAGRLIVPFNRGPFGHWKVFCLYSDDGRRWKTGSDVPDNVHGAGTEAQAAECSDGSLLLNARSADGRKLRKSSRSYNGGETWTAFRDETALPDPECTGSLLRTGQAGDAVIYFCNPDHPGKWRNGTLRSSRDDGESWITEKVISSGRFGYSCMTELPDGSIGILYEGRQSGSIRLQVFRPEN